MTGSHLVELLFREMRHVEPYPDHVIAFPARIAGTAFFPGGYGVWNPGGLYPPPPLRVGGVMVLGQDFHSRAGFERSLGSGGEVTAGLRGTSRMVSTWRHLLPLLKEAGISPEECFFTNAYMGLRAEATATGRFPGSRDVPFVERCQRFFVAQLRAQRPAVILSLGVWVPQFLAPLSPQLSEWRDKSTLAAIDDAGPLVSGVRFGGYDGECVVLGLAHPSFRNLNVRRRRYGAHAGAEAELAMLADARTAATRSPTATRQAR